MKQELKSRSFRQDELERKRDFFKDFRLNHKKRLMSWLIVTILLIVGLGTALGIISLRVSRSYAVLREKSEEVGERLVSLQGELKSLQPERLSYDNCVIIQKKLHKDSSYKKALVKFLSAVSKKIPEKTWLEKISFNQTKLTQKDVDKHQVELIGYSFDNHEILAFQHCLIEAKMLAQCRLDHFQKVKEQDKRQLNVDGKVELFHFCLKGALCAGV